MLVCGQCAETLTPDELVSRATQKTRADYAAANGIADCDEYVTSRVGRVLRLPV